jgi:hypothetical protein
MTTNGYLQDYILELLEKQVNLDLEGMLVLIFLRGELRAGLF